MQTPLLPLSDSFLVSMPEACPQIHPFVNQLMFFQAPRAIDDPPPTKKKDREKENKEEKEKSVQLNAQRSK